MNNNVMETIEQEKIIVIVRGVKQEQLLPFCEAVYEGGIRLLELTYTAGKSELDQVNADNIRMLREHFDGKMYFGAGTVMTKGQVQLTKEAGGEFIISPNTDEAVIRETKRLGLISMPGAMTPSEIVNAHQYGADFVKLFPTSTLGSEYIKAVSAPLSHIKLLAVGGVDTENIQEFLKAGAKGFGIGSNIVNKKMLAEGRYEDIRDLAKRYVEAVRG